MDKLLKIAVILTAVDQMSSVVEGAVGKSIKGLDQFKNGIREMRDGLILFKGGEAGFGMLKNSKEAFGEMQDSANELKAAMLQSGGVLDVKMYNKVFDLSQKLSDHLSGSTSQYLDMVRVLKNNNISEQDILGGVGENVAKLGVLFKMNPSNIGEFAARMRNDMGIAANDMGSVADLVARAFHVGVGKTGQESVDEMTQFFSKVGLGMANLHAIGLKEASSMTALGALFMRRGISGQSVGTNFRRILDGLRDTKKLSAANDVAKQFGVTLDFFDKNHKFRGIDNFVLQLGKLKGLNPQAIDAILKPFSGKQGLSTDFMDLLAGEGVEAFNSINKAMFRQAAFADKLNVVMGGMNRQQEIMSSSWKNTKAAVFESMAPLLTKIYILFNGIAITVRKFVQNHPGLTRFAVASLVVFSSLLMLAGSIKIVGGALTLLRIIPGLTGIVRLFGFSLSVLRIGTIALTRALFVQAGAFLVAWGPAIAVAALIGLVFFGAYKVIVKHFGSLGNFFSKVWSGIKNVLNGFFAFIKTLAILIATVFLGWLIPFDVLKNGISVRFDAIKNIFVAAFKFIASIFTMNGFKMYEAGKNLIMSVWKGIKAFAHYPIDAIVSIVKRIRGFFPFSPAKEGPLKDIHRVRLIETIAESMKPDAMVNKMRSIGKFVFGAIAPKVVGYSGPQLATAPIQITFAPVYYASPGQSTSDGANQFREYMRKYMPEFERMFDEIAERKIRRKF